MSKLKFGTGSIRIEMDDTLDRMVRQAAEKVAPGVLTRIESSIERIEAEASAKWPVASGRSKEGLEAHTIISPDQNLIRGTITNNAPYAYFIKSGQNGLGGKSAVVELIGKPIRAEAKHLAEDIGTFATKAIKS